MKSLMYEQATGLLVAYDSYGEWYPIADGYAGSKGHCNDPESQHLKGRGPLPRGFYRVDRPVDHPRLGPLAMYLEPEPETHMFGRSEFFIHGDNRSRNRTASEGCIILDRQTRELIARHAPIRLHVVRGWREEEIPHEMAPAV